jgi:taurine dioxygenase
VIEIREPAKGKIGAEVRLGSRSSELPEDVCRTIKDLVYRHRLVVIPGMNLQAREYVAFARNFGTPQVYFQDHYHHPEHPEIFVSSNVPYKGEKFGVSGTGRYWHTDYQFFDQPLPLTMLYPQAFDAKLRYKVQASDIDKSIAEVLEETARLIPPVWHPAIVEHPTTGESILYVSPGFTTELEGFDYESNRAFLTDLFEFITRPEHIHTQYWKEADILLWDNRTLLHKASPNPTGEPSVSFRIGIYDHLPFYRGLPPANGLAS